MTHVMFAVSRRAYPRYVDEKTWRPRYPERICWGCDKLCPANDLACGGGTIRTQHPIELFGDDWRPMDAAPDAPETDEIPAPHAD